MAYLTLQEARAAFLRSQSGKRTRKAATEVLHEAVASVSQTQKFDIFLSHSLHDAEVIAGVKAYLEEQGKTVYVDWMDDSQLSREAVTAATAEVLRVRMKMSRSLIFATSESSPKSKWMPWELGYFDGLHTGKVAVLPLVVNHGDKFKGQEYLGLYPLVEELTVSGSKRKVAFVTRGHGSKTFIRMNDFFEGKTDFELIG